MGNRVLGGIAMEVSYVRENAERVMEELEHVGHAAGRTPPTLVAVTKGGTDEEVLALVHTGLIAHIAENRVDKFLARRDLLTADGYRGGFHMIGSLQTNKVKHLMGKTTLIQSLDSLALAREIEKRAEAAGVGEVACLIEINSGRESAKGGIWPEEAERFFEALGQYRHIRIEGLMTMGPAGVSESETRKCFAETRELWEYFVSRGCLSPTATLSMGMSESYALALEEGANMVRIGRAFWKKQ